MAAECGDPPARRRVVLDETDKVLYGEKQVIAYASWGSNDPNRNSVTSASSGSRERSPLNTCRRMGGRSQNRPMAGISEPGRIEDPILPLRRKA